MRGFPKHSPCGVLVIDDDPDCAEELRSLLSSAGFVVSSEVTAKEGLRRFFADPDIGVVVTDVLMPRLDGLAVLDAVRAGGDRGHSAAVILLTTSLDPEIISEALARQATAFVFKPIDPTDIVRIVGDAIRARQEGARRD